MNNKEGMSWSLAGIWNEQLTFGRGQREPYKRDYIWGSEIGKDYYQRWLIMNATKPDFDFDERTLRKFSAGNFFERIVGFVLVSAGLLIYDNEPSEIPEDKDHLRISVRPDFIAGGKPDWEKVKKQIGEELLFKLMPNLGRIAEQLVKKFSKEYPDGLKELVFEIKSINSQLFWAKKNYLQEAYPHHLLQLFAGMKARNIDEGHILYISKDDLTTAEFGIYLDGEWINELYEKDVRGMTELIRSGKEPEKPEDLVFDKRKKLRFQHNKKKCVIQGCYTENWQIDWSNYITTITGLKGESQKDVEKMWKTKVAPDKKKLNDELKIKFKENE